MIETVRAVDPGIIAFQEVRRAQLAALVRAFPSHHAVGRPRDRTRAAETVPLFVHRDRFEIEAAGDLWLSPTPEVEGSRGWDARYPRVCTWARLRALDGDARFVVCNTHLDHRGATARIEAAELIASRAVAHGVPALIVGDLNTPPASAPLQRFRDAGFRDAFAIANPDALDATTLRSSVAPSRIDHILCDASWQILDARIIDDPAVRRAPSDHHPVVATLRFAG